MNKFYALVIMADLSLKRYWMDTSMVLQFLKGNKGAKVYRISNDQEAVLVLASDNNDQVLWQEVITTDYKVG